MTLSLLPLHKEQERHTLTDHLNRLPKRTPCLTIHAMRMRRRNDIWPRFVDLRMDHEPGLVDHGLVASFTHIAFAVDQHEIRRFHQGEVFGEGVDPEMILEDGIYNSSVIPFNK